ncbi:MULTISPECIES: hypothetical protein [unclassified Olleya]|jgi:flagellar basal body-associated protein FliL|uniref:hypothetical protein n=1 Tax=unclassified Olleya TaxID=2615019 RepID=UPI0011AE0C79|nr:hypothetical protein [Olleya sp. Hel_I_94]TVZ49925.1 hypothetical protein JM82_0365 [Olleya sp. Hel_I_94]|tara:strand:- start:114 stop:290 length:177 start_codon:yes stop_codon:yes gene_type:complete
MSESRRNRRKIQKEKYKPKSDISNKDKVIALIAMILIFAVAAIAAVYYSLSKAGWTLF